MTECACVSILGGNIKGKAHCENMCFSSSSFTNVCGPCLNPHDVTRTTGGSSSGSGALVITVKILKFRTLENLL